LRRRARRRGPRWWLAPLRLFFVHYAAPARPEVLHKRLPRTVSRFVTHFGRTSYCSQSLRQVGTSLAVSPKQHSTGRGAPAMATKGKEAQSPLPDPQAQTKSTAPLLREVVALLRQNRAQ